MRVDGEGEGQRVLRTRVYLARVGIDSDRAGCDRGRWGGQCHQEAIDEG